MTSSSTLLIGQQLLGDAPCMDAGQSELVLPLTMMPLYTHPYVLGQVAQHWFLATGTCMLTLTACIPVLTRSLRRSEHVGLLSVTSRAAHRPPLNTAGT